MDWSGGLALAVGSMDLRAERVVVTGASGFLGQHVMADLKSAGVQPLAVRSSEYDLRDEPQIARMYSDLRPTVVFHLAAEVGGIGANRKYPGQFFYNNLVMGANLIEYGRRHHLRKFVSVGTVCSYPKITPVPFRESDIWNGYPEETNAPYGLAKKMQLVQLQAYRAEYGFCGIHLLPSNLYGPYDHFDEDNGHVIPAMILKFARAVAEGADEVVLWGDGSPTREFLYAGDCARGLRLAAEALDEPTPINLGTGVETPIHAVASLIAAELGYGGRIRWDSSKPNGQPRRSLDVQQARELFGFEAQTPLVEGLRRTVQWYRSQIQAGG